MGVALAVVLLGPAGARADQPAPTFTAAPAIEGTPVVGETLREVGAAWTGTPAPTVGYQWVRCRAKGKAKCPAIDGATTPSYVLAPADAGMQIFVLMTATNPFGVAVAWSDLTDVVGGAPASPPVPDGTPATDPPAIVGAPLGATALLAAPEFVSPDPLAILAPASAPAPALSAPSRIAPLRPFPVIRIRGTILPGGALISLFSVRAPAGARIQARCVGVACPLAARVYTAQTRLTRLRSFERFLPAGVRLVVRVTRPGMIGKQTNFHIRSGRPPDRRDRCVVPGRAGPVVCPS